MSNIFTARRHSCKRRHTASYASAVYATAVSVRPSVCASIIFRCFVEMNEYDHAVFTFR